MATKTIATKSGKTIKIEFVREVQDKIANLDGDRFVTGREIIQYVDIYIYDTNGKRLASGTGMTTLHPKVDAAMLAKGAVARVGDAYLTPENADLVAAALAELDAENPKSDEQLEIERKKAEAHARWEADLPAIMAAEEFERKMARADSDY